MHKFIPSLHPEEEEYLMENKYHQLPEEDDFVAGLVEQMAHSMLDDEEVPEAFKYDHCHRMQHPGASSWGSSSSNASSSPVVSPPTPLTHLPFDAQQNEAWELLQMAVMRLKMGPVIPVVSREEQIRALRQQNGGIQRDFPTMYSNGKTACPSVFEQHDWKHRSTANGVYKPSCYNQVPTGWNRRNTRASAAQYQQQQQSLRQQQQQQQTNRMTNYHNHPGLANYRNVQQQQQHPQWPSSSPTNNSGSGMRAVFLRGPGIRSTTSTGTGVFLPQATGSSREQHRRKPACSTVLLPSRIVEVLNLNVDDLNCQQQTCSTSSNNGAMGDATAGFVSAESEEAYLSGHLSKSYSACSPTRWHHQHPAAEHALPTEWTY